MSIRLHTLLELIPSDTEVRVDRFRKQVSSSIRDAIRRETGLLLQRRQGYTSQENPRDGISVPVRLEPGLPTILQKIEFPDSYWLTLLISPYKADLENFLGSSTGLSALTHKLNDNPQGKLLLQGRDQHLMPLRNLTDELLKIVQKDNPAKRILEVNEDILGVYRYELPNKTYLNFDPMHGEIVLYWGVIGLFANLLGVAIEDLTFIIMAHEVAHAYTHLGADIDGKRWETDSFAKSDHALREGLAQYYTVQISQRLMATHPGASKAFSSLLDVQPDAYKSHSEWIKDNTPEEIRLAMLETRRKGIGEISDFAESLDKASKMLRRKGTNCSADRGAVRLF